MTPSEPSTQFLDHILRQALAAVSRQCCQYRLDRQSLARCADDRRTCDSEEGAHPFARPLGKSRAIRFGGGVRMKENDFEVGLDHDGCLRLWRTIGNSLRQAQERAADGVYAEAEVFLWAQPRLHGSQWYQAIPEELFLHLPPGCLGLGVGHPRTRKSFSHGIAATAQDRIGQGMARSGVELNEFSQGNELVLKCRAPDTFQSLVEVQRIILAV